MKKQWLILFLAILVTGVALTFPIFSGTPQLPVDALNNKISDLPPGSPLTFEDMVFSNMDPLFYNAKVIGIGEATHGTKQFFQLKQRLFKYLVEHHHCKALGFEFGFRFKKSLDFEGYVIYGEGDLEQLVADLHWIHRNNEFFDLITWMREYNSTKKKEDMIHFIGIDSQLDIWYGKELDQYILNYDAHLYKYVSKQLRNITNYGLIKSKTLSPEKYTEIMLLLSQLKNNTIHYFKRNPQQNQIKKRELLIHLIDSYILSHKERYGLSKKEYLRDSHMAEHSLWLLKFVGENAKIAIWAHNAHVARDSKYTPDNRPSMGKYLSDTLKDSYLTIGTSFTNGSFAAVTEDCYGKDTNPIIWRLDVPPPPDSINFLFQQAKFRNFSFSLVNLNSSDPIFKYLNKELPLLGIGDFYSRNPVDHYSDDRKMNLIDSFDIIFYFSDTNAISILPEAEE